MLESDLNHCAFHQSTQHYVVVRSKACEKASMGREAYSSLLYPLRAAGTRGHAVCRQRVRAKAQVLVGTNIAGARCLSAKS